MTSELCKGCGTLYINVESQHLDNCLVIKNSKLMASVEELSLKMLEEISAKSRARAERDQATIQVEKLSTGLVSRIEGRQSWVSPSAAETALNYIDRLKLEVRELTESLKNMVGCFGDAVTRLKMGKAFGEFHQEAVRISKEVLEKHGNA